MSGDEQRLAPGMASEFLCWLWWLTERDGGRVSLDETRGHECLVLEAWVDDKLRFCVAGDSKVVAAFMGESTGSTPPARETLSIGRSVADLSLFLRREDRQYVVTIDAEHLHRRGLKLPAHAADGLEALVFERMFLVEEVDYLLDRLFCQYALVRTSSRWLTVVAAIREWAAAPVDEVTTDGDTR